jgi:hypothetical protein
MGVAQADERDVWMFAQWAGDHENRRFREMLVDARLYGVVPIHQLLRSASDWRQCRASPFAGAAGQPLAGGAFDIVIDQDTGRAGHPAPVRGGLGLP